MTTRTKAGRGMASFIGRVAHQRLMGGGRGGRLNIEAAEKEIQGILKGVGCGPCRVTITPLPRKRKAKEAR